MTKRNTSDSLIARFYTTSQRFNDHRAISYCKNGQWFDLSWQQYREHVEATARFLKGLGVGAQSKIILFSQTRFEWPCIDYACQLLGAITVPIYHNASLDEVRYILHDSQSEIIFAENQKLATVLETAGLPPSLKKVLRFEPFEDAEFNFQNILANFSAENSETFWEEHLDVIETEQDVTHVYTSGTTGVPKAVCLTHVQLLSETTEAFPLLGVSERDRLLTFLPLAHILGRIEIWGQAVLGYQIAFAESIDRVKYNLKAVQPTLMVGVPRLFEKIQTTILSQVEKSKFKKIAFDWALKVGREVLEYRMNKRPVPIALGLQFQSANQTVFRQIADELGGKLRFAVVGGAALNPDTAYFFGAVGVQLLEGYGLTETTAAICVNTPFDYKYGTVGKPIGDVRIKLASDGEILVKSSKVMNRYKELEAQSAAFEGEYFKTGDIGEIDDEGFIKIVDRKKDLIKTSGGKYVAPQRIINKIKEHPLVQQVYIHGDQEKYIVALLTLDQEALREWAQQRGVKTNVNLCDHPLVFEEMKRHIQKVNGELGSYESVKKFKILKTDFTVEDGTLTPSLKLKKRAIEEKYRADIETLYN